MDGVLADAKTGYYSRARRHVKTEVDLGDQARSRHTSTSST